MISRIRLSKSVFISAVLGLASSISFYGCVSDDKEDPKVNATANMAATAAGNAALGTVVFTQEATGVRVKVNLTGFTPGLHGFHVHVTGNCGPTPATATAAEVPAGLAGGHYNPATVAHGLPDSTVHHTGDLGNLTADASGNIVLDKVYSHLSLVDTATTLVGHGLIVHALPDDGLTQPTGASGGRFACGIITK